jgi:uncharacterized protein YfaS (alpha-2-macroglobulin family)/TolA-binding protein
MIRRPLLLAVACAMLLAGGALALHAEEAMDRAADLRVCRGLMADRDWAAAEASLEAFTKKYRNGEAVEEAVLLMARARLLAGRPQDALETLRTFVEQAPKSAFAEKARWLMADAFVALRDTAGAASTLEARAAFLASPDHQQAIADLYLEIADAAFAGREVADDFGRKSRVHDWPRAAEFYRRARAVRLRDGDAARVSHRIAFAALESGDPGAAVEEWTRLLAADPGVLRKDAVFGLGRALLAAGDARNARTRLREVVDTWPDDDLAPRALILLGESWSPLSPASRADLERGLDAWREFRRLYDGHAEGPRVAHHIGLALAAYGDRVAALKEWAEFLRRYPTHELAPEVVHGMALARLGLEDFDGAVAAMKDLLARWPNHRLWQAARAMLPRIAQARAEAHVREERWKEAVTAFRAFLEEFPGDSEAPFVQIRLGDALLAGGDAKGALEAWRLVPEKWGGDPRAATAMDREAAHLAGAAGDLTAAIAAYERLAGAYPGTVEGQAAVGTLRSMKGRFLEASQVRPVTTAQRPRIAMSLRNIDNLQMKAYRVDLAEFVKVRGSLAGTESVVTDVVKADAEWTWRPEAYEPFRLLHRECEVPLDGPGSWIVRAQDEEFTATLLVVASDLGVVVKRSVSQTLVFVQNLRTGDPVAGARVLVPQGGDGTTGADGTWIGQSHFHPWVLAESGGHLAFAGGQSGTGSSFGYSTKVYHFTDRPLYRPGHRVKVKGFARRIVNGNYHCGEGEKVLLTVFDSRGNSVMTREVLTDAFGGVDADFPLSDGAPLGAWNVTAHFDKRTFTTTFEVREYRKPELEIAVTTPQPTYTSGEEIKATISVRYAVGGLARGVPVRWSASRVPFTFDGSSLSSYASWFHDPVREAERRRRTAEEEGEQAAIASGEGVTDAEGRLEVVLPTAGDDRDARFILELMVQDSGGTWTREAASWPVTQQGWFAVVRSERKVYRPREDMTLEVFTVNALQDPVPAKGRAVLARLRTLPGRVVEEEVSSTPVETGADGRAAVKIRAERPGEYALRFVGQDARGRPVEASAPVTVSGPAEDLSRDLKVLCDRETYREGDAAQVLVLVPAAPATVLLTIEGERVLEHRVLRLTETSSTVEVAMDARFSPNVFVRGAMLSDNDLKESGDEVLVFRFLQVEVVPSKTDAAPGETVSVTVRTTDQRGNPVPAGVAITAVDRALLSLQPDRTPDPRPFFYDQRRTHGVVSSGGVAFLPTGVTQPTSKDLLFEQARRLGRDAWEKFRRALDEGREALRGGDLEKARESLVRALEIAPGQYEAQVLLVQTEERLRADRERGLRERLASLGDKVSKEALRDQAESDMLESEESLGDPVFRGRPGKVRNLKAAGGGSTRAPAPASEESKDEIGIGGGGGGAFGGKSYRGPRGEVDAEDDGPHTETGSVFAGRIEGRASAYAHTPGGGEGGYLADIELPAALRSNFADVALWSPTVVTGADGRAQVDMALPDNLTTWVIRARGASRDTLVGEGVASLRARKDLLVRIVAPRFLGMRDRAEFSSVVHNETGSEVDVRTTLAIEGARAAGDVEARAKLAIGAVRPFPWTVDGGAPGLGVLRAEALSSVASDAASMPLPLTPHGIPWRRAASGTCRDMAVATLDLPEGAIPGTVRLRLSIAPDLDSVLLDAVRWNGAYPYGCLEQTVNRFLPALAAEDALRRVGLPDLALRDALREAVESGLVSLYGFQNGDGSFGWFPGGGDPSMTGYATLAMLRAEKMGHAVAAGPRAKAIEAARRFAAAGPADVRAFLLYALAHGSQASAEDLGSIHRVRESLSDRGLAWLAMAFSLSGRKDRAEECVALLRGRAVREGNNVHWDDGSAACRRRGLPVHEEGFHWWRDAEPTALALKALVDIAPGDPLEEGAVRWLLDHRRGPCWRTTRDTAFAVDALAAVLVRRGVERNDFNLRVFVDDGREPVTSIEVRDVPGAASPQRDLVLPSAGLAAGRHTVRLEKEGPGSFHWAVVLDTWIEGEDIPAAGNLLQVDSRFVRYIAPRAEGAKPSPDAPEAGWNCCDPSVRPGDDALPSVATAGSGDLFRCVVTLDARQDLDYALLEVPLPAGCEVVEGREQGTFARFERRDDRAVFFMSRLATGRHVFSFVLQAVFPGDYHVMPAMVSGMYEPEVEGRSAERRLRVVREAGAVNRRGDGESVTPDEILFLARRALAEGRFEAARDGFRTLLGGPRLLPEIEGEAWAAVRTASFRLSDHRGAVEAHEALLERDPRLASPSREDLLLLGRAYREVGEHERAVSLFLEAADRYFSQEREASEAFSALGQAERALHLRAATLRRYPDGSVTDAEEMALAGAMAVTRRSTGGGTWMPEAAERVRAFLSHRPALRNADQANHLLVDLLRRMELHDDAMAEGRRFLGRFPKSARTDDVIWFLAASAFDKGDHAAALTLANPLLDGDFPRDDDPSRTAKSPFRAEAQHLRGKVAHLRGELEEAVRWYALARHRIPDAADAYAFLTERRLEIPELASFPAGEEPVLRLRGRNIGAMEASVYPVDFMILYALRKELGAVNRIDLTGIVPAARVPVRFGTGVPRQWQDLDLRLPVKEKGVYLVQMSGDAGGSSLVLLSDLRMEVQRTGPRVRVYITDAKTLLPVDEVFVKVADGGTILAQGFTDARGIFEAPQVPGNHSVVAEKDGSYALFQDPGERARNGR